MYGVYLGGVTYNIVIAIIVFVIALAVEDLLYFDSKTYKGTVEALSGVASTLRSRGVKVREEPGAYRIGDPVEYVLSIAAGSQGSGEEVTIRGRARVAPWFLGAVLVIMALNAWMGLALAFLGYLYYRYMKSNLEEALRQHNLKAL